MIRAPVFPRGKEISGPTFAALRRGEQRRSGYPSRGPRSPLLYPASRMRPRITRIARISFCRGSSESVRSCPCSSTIQHQTRLRPATARQASNNLCSHAFTLLELLVVIGIIAILMVLVVPAFTNIKSGNDVTSAGYTIKGALDTARTYAKANNTYTWVGFFEEDISSGTPGTTGVGRLVMSIVASKDGTSIYDPNATGTNNWIDPTRLTQVTKLVKIDNLHLPLFAVCTANCTGDTFDTRPVLQFDPFGVGYNGSRFGELNAPAPNTAPYDTTNNGLTKFPFQYPVGNPAPTPQYQFRRTLQFSPLGECRINSTYDVRRVVEVGLLQTHGTAVPTPIGGSGTTLAYSGNVAAVQITGFGSSVKIYRR